MQAVIDNAKPVNWPIRQFTAEVVGPMRVLGGAGVVFRGVSRVQPQTEPLCGKATQYKGPRISFVSKMDAVGANFKHAVNDLRQKLLAYAFQVFLVAGAG